MYLKENVWDAALKRFRRVFDEFSPENGGEVLVSFSGGKDSVHAESKLLVRWRGRIERIAIGDLAQKIKSAVIVHPDGRRVHRPTEFLEVCTASTNEQKTAKCQFVRVTGLMDHPHSDDLYEFTLSGGRTVRMTGCHSAMKVFAHNGLEARPVQAKDLAVGDMMFTVNDYGVDQPDDPMYDDWFLRLAGFWLADGCYAVDRKFIISTGNMPEAIEFLKKIPRSLTPGERSLQHFNRVRGKYTKQSDAINDAAQATGVKPCAVINAIYRGFKRTHQYIKAKVLPNGDVWMCDKSLVTKMKEFGLVGTSHTKTVPNKIFSLSRRQIGLFLAGYFDGDGSVSEHGIAASSVSGELARGIADACSMIGVSCSLKKRLSPKSGFRSRATHTYFLSIQSAAGAEEFKKNIPTWKIVPDKATVGMKLQSSHSLGSHQIVSIDRIPSGGRVYDVEVDSQHTFIADGVLVHNSTITLELALLVAREKNRLPLRVFWLDQEAEWNAVVEYQREVMNRPEVLPLWFQGPFRLFNATTTEEDPWLHCWDDREGHPEWIRPKEPNSIHENKTGTDRFGELFSAFTKLYFPNTRTANLAGVRCEESPTRLQALTSTAKYKDITWGNAGDGTHLTFYPLYDWSYRDVWKAIHEHKWNYCDIYNKMHQYGIPPTKMRVSNVHHETSVHCLHFLQEVEPDTWSKIAARVPGVNAITKIKECYACPRDLPKMFVSWREYRDYLLEKIILDEKHKKIFKKRFAQWDKSFCIEEPRVELDLMKHCIDSILINDWEFVKHAQYQLNNARDTHKGRARRAGVDGVKWGAWEELNERVELALDSAEGS